MTFYPSKMQVFTFSLLCVSVFLLICGGTIMIFSMNKTIGLESVEIIRRDDSKPLYINAYTLYFLAGVHGI